MASGSINVDNVVEKGISTIKDTKHVRPVLQNMTDGFQPSTHFAEYEESVIVGEQPLTDARGYKRVLPVYTLNWTSRPNSYFMPVTGMDFLTGVPEILLLQATIDLQSNDSIFAVKIPNGETLYLGVENSTSVQRTLFCSQRSFNMAFLDPNKQEAVTFVRKGAIMNLGSFLRQELVAFLAESNTPLGRIQQNNSLRTVSFNVLDEQDKQIYKIVGSESTVGRKLNEDVHFSILDPVDRTGGVILHKWDNNHKDFVYHITFPPRDIPLQHKMLLIGVALLVEYTYFKKSGCFCLE